MGVPVLDTRAAVSRAPSQCTSAIPTLLTPLHAMYTLPSAVAAIFLITPPPEGTAVDENFFVWGSNRTSLFGFVPLSAYHTVPSGVTVMPYGLELLPPGEAHSSTCFVLGSKCPRYPRS